MRLMLRQSVIYLLLAAALLAGTAMAQVQVGDNASISMNGMASFGYNGLFAQEPSNQLDFGFSGDLTGYYYTPKFINFRVSPYYNQSRLNSNINSVFNGKGLTSTMNLFSGSKIPLEVSYDRAYTNEGQFNVPGATSSYISTGKSESFNVGWSFLPDNLPTLHVGYGLGSSESSLLSATSRNGGNSRVFSLGSGYTLWGFALGGSYVNSHLKQTSPSIADFTKDIEQDTHQATTQFSISRPLTRFASFGTQVTRSEYTADYIGNSSKQTYDTVSSSVSVRPFSKFSMAFNVNYSTNLSAMLIQSLLPGSTTANQNSTTTPVASLSDFSGEFFSYRATAAYSITSSLSADADYDHRVQSGNRADPFTNDSVRGGLRYGHSLLGGQMGMYYGVSETLPQDGGEGIIGHTGSITYAHDLWGWRNSGGFGITRSEATSLVNFSQSGYQYNFSTSRNFGLFLLSLGVRYQQSRIDGLASSANSGFGYSASVSRGKLSVSGSVGQQDGNSLQLLGGVQQTPVAGQLLFPNSLVLYSGSSYAVAASYSPSKRMRFTGDYGHSMYSTVKSDLTSNNLMVRYGVKSEYDFRQLRVSCGYTHITQGLGASFNTPVKVNSIYIGVSRHFSLF